MIDQQVRHSGIGPADVGYSLYACVSVYLPASTIHPSHSEVFEGVFYRNRHLRRIAYRCVVFTSFQQCRLSVAIINHRVFLVENRFFARRRKNGEEEEAGCSL